MRFIGASGMVYSMVAIWLFFFCDLTRDISFHKTREGYSFYPGNSLPKEIKPQTSYSAHAYGFLIGFIAALCMLPMVSRKFKLKKDFLIIFEKSSKNKK